MASSFEIKYNNSHSNEIKKSDYFISFDKLLEQPYKYNGKTIELECFYFQGFEIVVLASKVYTSKRNEKLYYQVKNGNVWAFWGVHRTVEEVNKFEEALSKVPGRIAPNFYGRVKVKGMFFVDEEGIGHLGEYKYGFRIKEISVFDEQNNRFIEFKFD